MTTIKARCTGCDFIVPVNDARTALPHGWVDSGQCPGTGQPTEPQ